MYHNRLSSGLFEGFLLPQYQNINIYNSYLTVPLPTPFFFKLTALNLHWSKNSYNQSCCHGQSIEGKENE